MYWVLLLSFFHAFYLSVIEMKFEDEGHLDVTLKVFSDDLADAVRIQSGSIIPREGAYENSDLNHIEDYFKSHFFLHDKADSTFFEIRDYSTEDQTVWIQMNAEIKELSSFTLNASHFMEVFPDQINILHLIRDEQKHFYQFKKGKETQDLKLK
jgi:hypothetical protein